MTERVGKLLRFPLPRRRRGTRLRALELGALGSRLRRAAARLQATASVAMAEKPSGCVKNPSGFSAVGRDAIGCELA